MIKACGNPVQIKYLKDKALINFGRNYPNQKFTAVFENPISKIFDFMLNQPYCVIGLVNTYKGNMQINIKVVDDIVKYNH
jgi:hypothetical protein